MKEADSAELTKPKRVLLIGYRLKESYRSEAYKLS